MVSLITIKIFNVMKKFFAITFSISLITLFAFQQKESVIKHTPLSANIVSDTSDIDEQMRLLEQEMKIWEKKMKPLEEEMHRREAKMKPYEDMMKQVEAKMKPLEKQMKDLSRKLKTATNDNEREKISQDMDKVSQEMGNIGNEMSAIGDKMSEVGDEMSDVGEKMNEIGNEMSKIGEKMSVVGEKMEARHKKIFSWFFQELKKEGLVSEGDCSIIMEQNIFIVNGKILTTEQYQKYKSGIEQRLEKSLKSNFSIYFKGVLEKVSDSDFDFSGTSSSHY